MSPEEDALMRRIDPGRFYRKPCGNSITKKARTAISTKKPSIRTEPTDIAKLREYKMYGAKTKRVNNPDTRNAKPFETYKEWLARTRSRHIHEEACRHDHETEMYMWYRPRNIGRQ